MNLGSNNTEAQAVIDIALRAARPVELAVGQIYAVATASGQIHQIDLTGEQYLDTPKRKAGTTVVRDVPSFMAYFDKHADKNSELYADVERRTITAVLDAHTGQDARWGRHRLELQLRHTTAWTAWTGMDNRLVPQDKFADFVEDNLVDFVEPTAATMLELAESFEATTTAEFQSSQRLDSGQRKFAYTEDVQAKAGHRGEITIPATLTLALKPFEGTEPYKVLARFKYRLDKGNLTLGFKIERPEDILAAAFADIRTLIDSDTEMAVLNGSPTR
ncbi:DUF2303 family protein [Streptomyces sp. NPDC057617]|uniref:DUF2303 family protein n=1 Tax=Streptomyces sp. NPDC057617 TaxID=3346184 RepID=UPI0036C03F88